MLIREETLRLCAATQRRFRAAGAADPAGGVVGVVEALQLQVAAEFGLDAEIGVTALRSAELWLGEARARELSLYRRHNRCAHACDEWPISQLEQEIPRHRCAGDRLVAATRFAEADEGNALLGNFDHVLLDTMDDAFESQFHSWPFRWWVLQAGRVAHKPMPKGAAYDIGELEAALEELCA
ncbi:hypothetical protein M885DRAFT_586047 [Pelagophyceae sp. CCMP2097]|nr:hypothetical protein M885DRAFT_586047 [Pelagophyceae sp. CCMP2097]